MEAGGEAEGSTGVEGGNSSCGKVILVVETGKALEVEAGVDLTGCRALRLTEFWEANFSSNSPMSGLCAAVLLIGNPFHQN